MLVPIHMASLDCSGDSYPCILYVCLVDGVWVLLAKLTAPDGVQEAYLGAAVSFTADGTRLAAGAYGDADMGYRTGSVYIFGEGGVYICVTVMHRVMIY